MRLLIVSFAWPPVGRVGALRPLGLAREWCRLGHEVHVLTGPGDRGGELSPDLVEAAQASGAVVHRAAAPGMPVPVLPPAGAEAGTLVASRPPSRMRQVLAQWRNFPDYFRSWIPEAVRVGSALNERLSFDAMLSTSPPESVHFVGQALSRHGVPWVADFRDPWSDYPWARWDPLSRLAIDAVARRVLRPARAVTTASEGIASSIARVTQHQPVCVRNGFDHAASPSVPSRKRTIGYFGRIDPLLQRPERLWSALQYLKGSGTPWRAEFHLTPGGGGGARVTPPPETSVDVHVSGVLPHAEAIVRMQQMTVNLVLCLEVSSGRGIVPGKLYEYVGAGRPVLVCAPPAYEARQLVERTGVGLGAWRTHELVSALQKLEGFIPSPEATIQFSRENRAKEMLEVLRSAGRPEWPRAVS